MDVGELRGLGAARIDDDERAVLVARDLLQDGASPREAVRLPRVLADEDGHLGVLVVTRRVALRRAEQLPVDPELARLLLRERVRSVPDAECLLQRGAVTAAEMVPLTAAAVI